jgi:hypothetical protein
MNIVRSQFARLLHMGLAVTILLATAAFADHNQHHSTAFKGAKVNGGTATHSRENGKSYLMLSSDFKIPDTPDPHWQVVDSRGQVYLLQALKVKGGKDNRRIELPAYIQDVAKVQIWCAFAEVLLGEANFASPVS